jgi:hypothetical protein
MRVQYEMPKMPIMRIIHSDLINCALYYSISFVDKFLIK